MEQPMKVLEGMKEEAMRKADERKAQNEQIKCEMESLQIKVS